MQFRLSILATLLSGFVIVPTVNADPPSEPKKKPIDTQAETRTLSREEQQKRDEEEKARLEALRQKVVSNISMLVEPLKLTRSQNARLNALLGEDQFETAVETFKSTREAEIHDHAHNVAKTTIPGMMRKFMPSYMQKELWLSGVHRNAAARHREMKSRASRRTLNQKCVRPCRRSSCRVLSPCRTRV
jgi:superfamily II DNA helicase RecQ